MQSLALRPFQRRFLRAALAPGIDTAALCLPRANGKTTLAAHILARCLTPGDSLHKPGADFVLCWLVHWNKRAFAFASCGGSWNRGAGTRSWTLRSG